MKLGDLIKAKVGDQDANFWIIRRGDSSKVGKPTREFNPEHIGVTVVSDTLDANYLYYMIQYLWMNGIFSKMAKGSLRLVNITVANILNIPVETK